MPLNIALPLNRLSENVPGIVISVLADDDFGYNRKHLKLQAYIFNMKQYCGSNTFLTEELEWPDEVN